MNEITTVTNAELQATIDAILKQYPWFADHPVRCHTNCTKREISDKHGRDTGDAWSRYDTALWLLTGQHVGKRRNEVTEQ